ncbi:hypothetical protein [Variovorax sp. EL159]|uniref:hypothetical protein n=1 Tax=Variovorax sp. EL159 TaxID=1566270 RepID=UPI00088BD293|nr:hypothetical protein [Variovorax sp. EL159]SCX73167.1 hypothetical protein SAMN03159363_4893 [Variovorax sp. EL159]
MAGKVHYFSINLQSVLAESRKPEAEIIEKQETDNHRARIAAFALASKFVQSLNE